MNSSRPFDTHIACLPLILIFCLFSSFLFSCTSDMPQSIGRRGVLQFSLRTDDMQGKLTRGADEDESRIEDLRVVCFDNKGKIVGNYGPEKIQLNRTGYIVDLERADVVARIAVLANWEEYGLNISGIEDPESLKSAATEYLPGAGNGLIPMFGESPYSEEGECTVEMARCLAKVEIWDNMDVYEILSATLMDYGRDITPGATTGEEAAGKVLTFTESEGKDCFYAYIPPVELKEEDSARRKIELKLKKEETGEEADYVLWLKDYKENESVTETWDCIAGNHRYVFNVKGIDSPTPPEDENGGKVEIRWWPTRYGKFMIDEYSATTYQTCRLLLKDKETGKLIIRIPEAEDYNTNEDRGNYPGYFELYVNLDLDKEGVKLENLYWMVSDLTANEISNPEDAWDDTYAEKLSDKPATEENGGRRIKLTTTPILFKDGPAGYVANGTFPTTGTYRICWKNPEIAKINKIMLNNTSTMTVKPYLTGEKDGYHHADYTLSHFNITEKTIFIGTSTTLDPRFRTNDFFVETIDGKEYYVLYLD